MRQIRGMADWTDWDVAAYILAQSLGIIPWDLNFQTDTKHVFWTSNVLGDELREMLDSMARIGFLEYRDEPDQQFRLNPDYAWRVPAGKKGR